jgi:hypothetical protein
MSAERVMVVVDPMGPLVEELFNELKAVVESKPEEVDLKRVERLMDLYYGNEEVAKFGEGDE